jgi:hypothetical protein
VSYRPWSLAFALVIGVASGTGCVAAANEPQARHGPAPAPLPEVRTAAPAPGMVWVAGSWHWDGIDYVWLPGRWESPPSTP